MACMFYFESCMNIIFNELREWVSSFLTAHQHIIGYSVPYNGLENAIKDGKYNQGYLAKIKYEKTNNIADGKNESKDDKKVKWEIKIRVYDQGYIATIRSD